MPVRNLLLVFVTVVVSLACYYKAQRNRYASVITEVMGIVERDYVEPVGRHELFEHAMNGLVSGLDPYSRFIPASEMMALNETIEQRFGGVGILVEMHPETKRLTVSSPLFDTPAHKAGVLSGDTILKIDGDDTEGMALRDAVDKMRGALGTKVTLSILHRGQKDPVEMTLTRTEIHSQSVLGDKRIAGAEWDFHLQEDPRIGLFRVTSFGKDTAKELAKAINDGDFKAIILDLRNNPGGVLFGAIDICSLFIDSGVVVSTRGRDGQPKEVFEASGDRKVDPSIPMVVLVNHYSASASEIVSACLQDYERAVVIGARTWGKGTVQNVIKLEGGRNAVNLTTSSYWRPSNKNIHRKKNAAESDEWGVSPNSGFEVKLTDEDFEKVVRDRARRDAYRPYEAGKPEKPPEKPTTEVKSKSPAKDEQPFDDPQMRKAIVYLKEKLSK